MSLVDTPVFSRTDQQPLADLRARLNLALRGKADVVERVLVCLLANGHLLLEDKPGLGKTTLAKTLASGLGGSFARCQCTPDLLPSDITGFNIFNQSTREFEFRSGPVFSDILLADEINRATPRTQSALLEAMAERQVTVDNHRYSLSQQFFVIATQNPVDQHGTYPLPEAQLDRFAMKLSVGYPEPSDELAMLQNAVGDTDKVSDQHAVLDLSRLREIQASVARLTVARQVQEYLVRLGQETRRHSSIALGLSPRGLLTWQRIAQSHAWLAGRSFVTPDDVQDVAHPVLSVRMGLEASEAEVVIDEILSKVAIPPYREGDKP